MIDAVIRDDQSQSYDEVQDAVLEKGFFDLQFVRVFFIHALTPFCPLLS